MLNRMMILPGLVILLNLLGIYNLFASGFSAKAIGFSVILIAVFATVEFMTMNTNESVDEMVRELNQKLNIWREKATELAEAQAELKKDLAAMKDRLLKMEIRR